MKKNLNAALISLMNAEGIRSRPKLLSFIRTIKDRTVNDAETAYLLGLFFKYQYDPDNLPQEGKKDLIDAIRLNNVSEEYYLRKPVGDKDMYFFTVVGLVAGIILMIGGLLKLLGAGFWRLENLRFLQLIIDDGRFTMLSGLLIGLPCLISIFRSRKMMKLIRSLQNKN